MNTVFVPFAACVIGPAAKAELLHAVARWAWMS
jgi:hypothetical protein